MNGKINYIDLHCDTITMVKYPKENLAANNNRMVSIDKLKQGQALVQCFAAFVPTGIYPKPLRNSMAWKKFCKIADKKDALLKLHEDEIMPILSVADIEAAQECGKIGALFTIEDAGVWGNDLSHIEESYKRGVRIASLTWNFPTTLANPTSKKPEVMAAGLTDLGFRALEIMNDTGIVADVSHLSDGGFYDIAKASKKPFIATHSNSRQMCGHRRNLTDDQIKVLADKGGVMGLNFSPEFLPPNPEDKKSTIEDMVRHVLHIRDLGGSGILAMGTDFDGIHGDMEIPDASKMPLLFDALGKAGLSDDELEAMARGNIIRVFKECWK